MKQFLLFDAMAKQPSLKINAISNWISLFVYVAIGFFLTPFIIAHLGKSGYGIWVLVGSFIGYYGLLNLGVGSAITRYIARYSAQNDIKSLNETANTALVMFCVTGLLAVIISFSVAEPLSRFFKVAPDHLTEFKRIVRVLGIATGLTFPASVFSAMLTARERFVAVNIVNISVNLLRTGLTVIILLAGHGLAGIAYPMLASAIVSLVVFAVLARRTVSGFKIYVGSANFAVLKMLLVFGGVTTIIAIADMLRLNMYSIVIGRLLGLAEVGMYGVAAMMVRYFLNLVSSALGVLMPRFSALDGAGNHRELKDKFLQSLSVFSFIACGVAVVAILFGRSFILIWVGSEFERASLVLVILVVSYTFALAQSPGVGIMFALNRHRYYAAATMIEAILNVLLSILLAPRYGIIGVAMGTAIPMMVVSVCVQPFYVSRIVGLHLAKYMKALAPAFFIFMGLILANVSLIHFWDYSLKMDSYLNLIIGVLTASVLYFSLIIVASPNVRSLTLSLLPRMFEIKMAGPQEGSHNV